MDAEILAELGNIATTNWCTPGLDSSSFGRFNLTAAACLTYTASDSLGRDSICVEIQTAEQDTFFVHFFASIQREDIPVEEETDYVNATAETAFLPKSYPHASDIRSLAIHSSSWWGRFHQKNGWWLKTLFLFFLSLLLYAILRLREQDRRKLVADVESKTKPPYVWNIQLDDLSEEVNLGENYQLVLNQLRQRTTDDYRRLSIPLTIGATIKNAGQVAFCYAQQTRPPEYLLLIDRHTEKNHRAKLFDLLFQSLKANEVFVERYFYNGDPRLVYNEAHPEGNTLNELYHNYPNARLLILGNAYQLLSPTSGKVSSWARFFEQWRERSILTPKAVQNWGKREKYLAELFHLLPASLQGFYYLIDQFELGNTPDPQEIKEKVKDAPLKSIHFEGSLLGTLRANYSEAMIRWIASCAIYPSLHWDLTLYLGRLLSSEAHPLLTMDNLLDLTRLPWFVEGYISEEARAVLLDYLEMTYPGLQSEIREELQELLQKNPPPSDSAAWGNYSMNLALNEWSYNKDKNRQKELEKEIEQKLETGVEADFTVIKYLEREQTPLDFLVPDNWKKFLTHGDKVKADLSFLLRPTFYYQALIWVVFGVVFALNLPIKFGAALRYSFLNLASFAIVFYFIYLFLAPRYLLKRKFVPFILYSILLVCIVVGLKWILQPNYSSLLRASLHFLVALFASLFAWTQNWSRIRREKREMMGQKGKEEPEKKKPPRLLVSLPALLSQLFKESPRGLRLKDMGKDFFYWALPLWVLLSGFALWYQPDIDNCNKAIQNYEMPLTLTNPQLTIVDGSFNWIKVSPKGDQMAAIGVDDSRVNLYALSGGEDANLFGLNGEDLKIKVNRIRTANYSPDGQELITASQGARVAIWNAITEDIITILPDSESETMALSSPDGRTILTSSQDGTVTLWLDYQRYVSWQAHEEAIQHIGFSPDGSRIVSASSKTIMVRNKKGDFVFEQTNPFGLISSVSFFGDKSTLLVGAGNMVYFLDLENPEEVRRCLAHNSQVTTAFFTADGSKLITASETDSILVWNPKSLDLMYKIKANPKGNIACSPNGKILYVADETGIHRWNIDQPLEVLSLCLETSEDLALYNEFVVRKDIIRLDTTKIDQGIKIVLSSETPDSNKIAFAQNTAVSLYNQGIEFYVRKHQEFACPLFLRAAQLDSLDADFQQAQVWCGKAVLAPLQTQDSTITQENILDPTVQETVTNPPSQNDPPTISSEEQLWKKTILENTEAAYAKYLKIYPSGRYTSTARQRLSNLREEIVWRRTLRLNTIKAFDQFLQQYPNSKYEDTARKNIQALEKQNEPFSYLISIKTGSETGSGTDANVFIKIEGSEGQTKEYRLNDLIKGNSFEFGSTDFAELTDVKNMGEIKSVSIRHDNSGIGSNWYLESVTITPSDRAPKTFSCHCWIEGKQLEKTLFK